MLTSRQQRRNAVLHILDGVFFMIAMALFSREIVIPALIKELTESKFLLGLRPTIAWICVLLPQLWYVRHVEGLPYKKPTVLRWAVVQRLGWVIFLIWISVAWSADGVTLGVFYFTLAIGAFGAGMVIPVWSDWYAKTTHENSWGWVLGIRWAIPALFIVTVSPVIKRVMNPDICPSPLNYQILLGVTILFLILSFVCATLVHEEPATEPSIGSRSSWRAYMKRMAWISLRRPDFRLFMLTNMLSHIPLMIIVTFLTRYALTLDGITQSSIAGFCSYYFGFLALGAIVSGRISDKFGPTMPCRIHPILTTAACAVACFWRSADAMVWTYGLWGVAFGMWTVSNMPILFRYAGPSRRPIYTAVSMTMLGVTAASAPPIVGWLLDKEWITFNTLFLIAALMALCSWILFMCAVPRWPMTEEHVINSNTTPPPPDHETPPAPDPGD